MLLLLLLLQVQVRGGVACVFVCFSFLAYYNAISRFGRDSVTDSVGT